MSITEPSIDELVKQLEELQLQEALVIERIKRIREKEQQSAKPERPNLDVGSRVRIINPTRRNITSPISVKDKFGTVTKVTDKRVFFTTDNGVNTRRDRKNLEVL